MSERYAENRSRIATGVAAALESISLPPAERRLIEMVVRGEETSVLVGCDVVEALSQHQILTLLVSIAGDLDAPGWRHVERRVESSHYPWIKTTIERDWRVMAYQLREPGLPHSSDLGGHLTLEAVIENSIRNYNRWKLRWDPEYSLGVNLQPLQVSSTPPVGNCSF